MWRWLPILLGAWLIWAGTQEAFAMHAPLPSALGAGCIGVSCYLFGFWDGTPPAVKNWKPSRLRDTAERGEGVRGE